MRSPFRLLAPAALALGIFALAPAALAVDAVTVNVSSVLNDTTVPPIGVNTNYLMDSDRRRPGVAKSTATAIGELRPKFLRYPGGEKSDAYLWSVAPWTSPVPTLARTGPNEFPASSRQFTLTDNATFSPKPLDFDEFIAICRSSGAEPVVVVCYDSMYLAATAGGTKPTRQQLLDTAREWVRYANVTKSYNVKYWEIGNETDYGPSYAGGNPGATTYAADVVEFSRVMKAIDPTIKIGANGKGTTTWFTTVLANASAAIDFVSVHTYPTFNWTNGYDTFRNGTPSFTGEVNAAIGKINAHAASAGRIKVAMTETNAIDFGTGWSNTNDIGHALVVFDLIGQHLKKPEVIFTQLWNTRWIDNDAASTPIGTTNLLSTRNPGFEDNFTNWNENFDATAGNSVITTTASEIKNGAKAVRVSGSTEGGRGQTIASLVTPNTVYTMELWAKVTNTTTYAGGGITFKKNGVNVGGASFTFNSTSYKKYTGAFRAPASFDFVDVWCYRSGGTSVMSVDDYKLTEGAIPSVNDAIGPANQIYPTGRALAIWGEFMRDKLVSATGTSKVLAYASHAPASRKLSVFLVNKETSARDTTVALQNYPGAATAQRWIFKGTNDPADASPVWAQSTAVAVSTNSIALDLDPVSITVLVLDPAPTVATPASAALSGHTSATLGVLGADDGGETGLTYTWTTVGTPPAPVSFSANGNNAAKNPAATFTQPGNYSFQVTITDTGGLSATSAIALAVPPSFALWVAGKELSGANTAFDADANANGIANGAEYALRLDALPAPRDGLPQMSLAADPPTGVKYLTLSFRRPVDISDVTFTVEISSDLQPAWLQGSTYAAPGDAPENPHTEQVSRVEADGIETVVVRDKTPVTSQPRRFIRLRLTPPPESSP